MDTTIIAAIHGRIARVFRELTESVEFESERKRILQLEEQLSPGKMLRTRLGLALYDPAHCGRDRFVAAAAAVEMIHTATLFHDDVIDGGTMRRQRPTLWREIGTTGAILLGDLMLSKSMEQLLELGDIDLARRFISKINQLCQAELEHELIMDPPDSARSTAIRLARGKTGTLFAFIAESAAGRDEARRRAFCEAGFLFGAAYQLKDDLLDVAGNEDTVGKTLGTDEKRLKFTLPQIGWSSIQIANEIDQLCDRFMAQLAPWPEQLEQAERLIDAVFSRTTA